MQILFPRDFFKPKKPNEMFKDQATAFEKQGMEFSTVNISVILGCASFDCSPCDTSVFAL
ncbi:MAG: hypothetical protein DRQ49_03410 [Gammaproteobacteria bacterium]|nr:MAG: hypothetical protein DRQ41_09790 [Gammaproteobacteria bacterium]RKZ41944.1 MAG: hypothetical protein DRQ49_03410 [Gammaproteobacteria bacterium]RKZ76149.1 MAG: hypothetical protein DRQ57_04855 [Gammaproteobacteria bacterium]